MAFEKRRVSTCLPTEYGLTLLHVAQHNVLEPASLTSIKVGLYLYRQKYYD